MPYSETNFIVDHINATETINKMWWSIDRRDWHTIVDKVLARELDIDYTSILGGSPKKTTGKAQADEWRGIIETVDRSHHAASTVIIDLPQPSDDANISAPNTVKATSNGIVAHVKQGTEGGTINNAGGYYYYELMRDSSVPKGQNPWRISSIKATSIWLTGNPAVLEATVVKADV
jgi:hypothetical protein